MHWQRRSMGRLASIGVLAILSVVAIASRADDEADRHHTVTGPSAEPTPRGRAESAEQITAEILQLRERVGSAWRGEALTGPSSAAAVDVEHEAIRTALLAQARAEPSGERLTPRPDPASQKAALRDAAYQLDLAAHGLEIHDLYEEADRLRTMAQDLRQQARGERQPVLLLRHGLPFRPAAGSADN